MRFIYLLTTAVMLPVWAFAADHTDECCEIVAIDARDGTVRLEIGGPDRTFTLQIGSADLLGSLEIGQQLDFEGQDDWDSLGEGQSLTPTGFDDLDPDSIDDCCNIVDVSFGSGALAAQEITDGITIEILEMRRINDKVLQLTFVVDNQTDSSTDLLAHGILRWVGSGPTKQATGIELHDLVGLTRYYAGSASQSRDLDVPPGSRREYWAQYQAPPGEIQALTVTFPDAPPLYDVPIR